MTTTNPDETGNEIKCGLYSYIILVGKPEGKYHLRDVAIERSSEGDWV